MKQVGFGISAVAFAAMMALVSPVAAASAASPAPDSIAADGQITIAEVRSATTDQIIEALKALSGAGDVTLVGGKEALLEQLEVARVGLVPIPERVVPDALSPTAASTGDSTTTNVSPLVVVNDASITYQRRTGGRSSLLVCHNWGTSGCASGTGSLSSGQNSASKFGWSDTDGYLHPSNSCKTRASATFFLQVSYSFYDYGWIKVSGLYGGAWVVEMWC